MGIDGIFLYNLKNEIASVLEDTRLDKIHQPSKEELVLLFRAAGLSKRLFISIRPSCPRLNFTEHASENPAEPPMFCMLMRKYLAGAKFLGFEDTGFERVASLMFNSINEMGDSVCVKLIIELIGKQTNVILVGGDGKIIDSLRRSDLEAGGRIIQSGAVYTFPERLSKLDIISYGVEDLVNAVCCVNSSLQKAIVSAVDGVSPLIARELCVIAGLDTDMYAKELGEVEKESLKTAFCKLNENVDKPVAVSISGPDGIPFEFSYMPISQYGNTNNITRFASFSELLDAVYFERDRAERVKSFAADLIRLLGNLRARAAKKTAVRQKELEHCKDGEKYRIYGEILKANSYGDFKGAPYADLPNYYDPECKPLRIPLDPSLSVVQNAQRYFKEYKKCCNAAAMLDDLIVQSENELLYIESVIDELSRAQSVADLREIRAELVAAGYLRANTNDKRKKAVQSAPIETVSPDGFTVLIGRNNRQNDELTLKMADKDDVWFHTKNIPGSHVIVRSMGKELPESTIIFAAALAAGHSKAAASSSVPVDYTEVKYVKKPSGAKPGMVIYKTNKTVFVTPIKEIK